MDDERIRQLTREVLSQIQGPGAMPEERSLETRVAALEAAVAGLGGSPDPVATAGGSAPVIVVQLEAHPSRQLLNVAGGTDHCLLEPQKPCVQSGCCRALGH